MNEARELLRPFHNHCELAACRLSALQQEIEQLRATAAADEPRVVGDASASGAASGAAEPHVSAQLAEQQQEIARLCYQLQDQPRTDHLTAQVAEQQQEIALLRAQLQFESQSQPAAVQLADLQQEIALLRSRLQAQPNADELLARLAEQQQRNERLHSLLQSQHQQFQAAQQQLLQALQHQEKEALQGLQTKQKELQQVRRTSASQARITFEYDCPELHLRLWVVGGRVGLWWKSTQQTGSTTTTPDLHSTAHPTPPQPLTQDLRLAS